MCCIILFLWVAFCQDTFSTINHKILSKKNHGILSAEVLNFSGKMCIFSSDLIYIFQKNDKRFLVKMMKYDQTTFGDNRRHSRMSDEVWQNLIEYDPTMWNLWSGRTGYHAVTNCGSVTFSFLSKHLINNCTCSIRTRLDGEYTLCCE